MNNSLDVAKYIIHWHAENKRDIPLNRLQVLMYYVQLYYLMRYDKPCFKEDIYAWDTAPTEPQMYLYFERKNKPWYVSLPSYKKYGQVLDSETRLAISEVLNEVKYCDTVVIAIVARNQAPWLKNHRTYISEKIPLEDMQEFVNTIKVATHGKFPLVY